MELTTIVKEWEEEISELYVLLQQNEEDKKRINVKLRESEMGQERKELTQRIKRIKNLIEQRRFEISGLKKAEQRMKGKKDKRQHLKFGAS